MKKRGNCYVTTEAMYHLLGGKAKGWKPMYMKWEGESHWFLQYEAGSFAGIQTYGILDPTAKQFKTKPDYSKAKGKGFLTKKPSRRAKLMMKQMLYQYEKP